MFKLRDYQQEIANNALGIIKNHGLVYLSMEVRTGKTFTAFACAERYGAKRVLFVTKKKAIGSIQSDYNTMNPSFDLFVINYESVHKINFDADFVIVDEAHGLGQFPKPSNKTIHMRDICYNLPIVFLSGTPSPESYSQLYHQFWISKNSPFRPYKNFYAWAKEYVTIKKKFVYNREMNDYSDAKIEKIELLTNRVFIDFTQADAGFDKKVNDNILYCDMSPAIMKLINIMLKNNVYEMKDGNLIEGDTAVKLKNKIHQISSGTVKDEDGNMHILDDSKAIFVRDRFRGQKIAIFYKFNAELDMLKATFPNWTSTPEDFQQSTDKVFLGQFQSAREGIRLDTADALIFFNIDFSYLSYEQGKNRLISKERVKDAPLYFVFSRGGIEEKIYKQVMNKKDYTMYYFKKDYIK